MKRIILCLLLAVSGSVCGFAQQTDPTLTAAVATQTEILKKIFKTRDKTQKEIQLEKKMLEYLQNAQGAMQNIYQIKRAAELVAVEIPNNMSLLRKSLPGHLKGTAIALMVSDELADATTQMITLFPFMKQLVTSGSYDVTNADGKTEKHKVNLLNSAERYYIANEWFGLDPEGWATVMSGKYIVEGLIWEWNYL